jgi:pimeloyl-ACP methyl ester carboxylesterase
MPNARSDDGVSLYYEETGDGYPVIFVHEFAGDHRSWEPQVQFFSRRYRCITYSARGFPPSEVPADATMYSQDRARDDIKSVLDHLGIAEAHVVGLSMGGFAVLHFGLAYPDRARSLVVAGCGYGAEPDQRERFQEEAEASAKLAETSTGEAFAERYAAGPTRVQFQNKDRRGWQVFRDMLAEHSMAGAAATLRGVQKRRPSVFDLEDQMKQLTTPTLILTGDEDEPCLIPNVFMKRTIPSAALQVLPNSGHAINLEEPAAFNAALADFFAQVDSGRWPTRDPRITGESILGVK